MPASNYNPLSRRFRYPTGHVAAILYRCLTSPTIRTLAPSLNRLMIQSRASAPQHTDPPPTQVLLDFTPGSGWRSGKVQEWYNRQPTTTFTSLEYWKEKRGVQHEFIVVTLSNGKYCRFDRAADEATRELAPLEEGTTSKDTARIVGNRFETKEDIPVELLLSLEFADGEDLSLILAVCYSIKSHAHAGLYNLYLYNCYFFSWTITCIAARRAVDWSGVTRSEEPWASIVETSLKQLVPRAQQRSKISTGFSKLGKMVGYKPKAVALHGLLEGTDSSSSEERFRELLRGPLNNIRPATEEPIRNLLLRSQLAPTLEPHIKEHVTIGATKVTRISAARAAGAMAIQEVSSFYPSKMTDLSYAGFKWDDHCNLAWEVAYMAAAAAADAPDRWSEEWDTAWQQHWDEKTASGDVEANRPVGQRAGTEAKTAWRNEWTRIDLVRQEHLPAIVDSMQKGLLQHIHDLDDQRLRLGERASASTLRLSKKAKAAKRLVGDLKALGRNQAPQPPLQDYIRMRIADHCLRVENFGFKSYEEALNTIEEAMHQIWIKTLAVLDGECHGG